MRKGHGFSISEMIELIKIYGTITSEKYFDKNQKYIALFERKYLAEVIDSLDFTPLAGGALYSKKYNLFIGANPHINCASFYSIK